MAFKGFHQSLFFNLLKLLQQTHPTRFLWRPNLFRKIFKEESWKLTLQKLISQRWKPKVRLRSLVVLRCKLIIFSRLPQFRSTGTELQIYLCKNVTTQILIMIIHKDFLKESKLWTETQNPLPYPRNIETGKSFSKRFWGFC